MGLHLIRMRIHAKDIIGNKNLKLQLLIHNSFPLPHRQWKSEL